METLLIGVAAAFNFLIIKWKVEHRRLMDAVLDILAGTILISIFIGTLSGMVIAMVASMIVSIALLVFPPKWSKA
jgi:hypothetical protein